MLTVTLQVKPTNQLPYKDPYAEAKFITLRIEKIREVMEKKIRKLKVVNNVVSTMDSKNEKIKKDLEVMYGRQDKVKKDTRQIRRERIDLKQELEKLGLELMMLDKSQSILKKLGNRYKQAF